MIGAFFSILLSSSGLYLLVSNNCDVITFISCQIAAIVWYIIGYFYHILRLLQPHHLREQVYHRHLHQDNVHTLRFDILSDNIKGGKNK